MPLNPDSQIERLPLCCWLVITGKGENQKIAETCFRSEDARLAKSRLEQAGQSPAKIVKYTREDVRPRINRGGGYR